MKIDKIRRVETPNRKHRVRAVVKKLISPHLSATGLPIREGTPRLIQMIATVFAIYRLLPRDYQGLQGPAKGLSLRQVMSDAWDNVQFTKEGLPQAILFFAIVGAMVFCAFSFIVIVLSFFMGTAHAAGPEGSSIFTPPNPEKDVALAWIKYLFLPGVTLPEIYPNMGNGIPQEMAYKGAFLAMLAFYSNAILIIAAVVLFYILTAMLVETAHHGVAMGKNANQIWSPIRLVMAVGLLVPLNGTLNSGQYIVVKLAEWGSGLASNAWAIYLNAMANYDYSALDPNAPMISKVATDLIAMGACQYSYNTRLDFMVNNGIAVSGKSRVVEIASETSVNGHKGVKYSFSTGEANGDGVCGWYFIPEIPGTLSVPEEIAAYKMETKVFWEKRGGFLSKGAEKIKQVMPGNIGGDGAASVALDQSVVNLVTAYQTALNDSMATLGAAASSATHSAIEEIKPWGWAFAGTFLPTIERFQVYVNNAALAGVPVTQAPVLQYGMRLDLEDHALRGLGWLGSKIVGFVTGNSSAEDKKWAEIEKGLNAKELESDVAYLASQDMQKFNLLLDADAFGASDYADLQCASMLGLVEKSHGTYMGNDIVDFILQQIEGIFSYLGLWDSTGKGRPCSSTSPAASLNTFQLGIDLGGPDIIQQMVAYGHKLIDAAIMMAGLGMTAQAIGSMGSAVPIVAGLGNLVVIFGLIVLFIAALIFASGFTLGIVLPMYVFTRFFFAVVSWIGGVIEGVVAIPLVALAHLSPEGHGLAGKMANNAYFFIFNIFLYPILIIFGMVTALLAFIISSHFLIFAYSIAVAASGGTAYGHETVSKVLYTALFTATMYISANNAFALIDHLPQQALKWMGVGSQVMPNLGDAQQLAQYESGIAAVAGQQAINQIGSVGKTVGEGVGERYKQNVADEKEASAANTAAQRHDDTMRAQGFELNEESGRYEKAGGESVQAQKAPETKAPSGGTSGSTTGGDDWSKPKST